MKAIGAVAVLLALGSCVVVPDPAAPPGGESGLMPPPGFGTLRQDDVTVEMRSGDLQVKVTPLAESVIRVTAPDTERRLRGLAESRSAEARQAAGSPSSLFLVSFFSSQPDVAFVPDELQLLSRNVRIRPAAILAVTPTWGQRRLRQRETEMAVYVFAGTVDLESDLAVVYGLEESWAWSTVLTRVRAERARARARSGTVR
jgi:hypothetical protein